MRRGLPAKPERHNPRAFSVSKIGGTKRKIQRNLDRLHQKEVVPLVDRSEAVAPPPPPGKVLVDEILEDTAAHVAELETAHQAELRRLKGLLAERGVPDGLICPLSLEIYEDPVVAADGFSYERREIENWFARGNRTSPKTNEELPHTFLVPNRDLKSTCQDFLDDVRKFDAGDV